MRIARVVDENALRRAVSPRSGGLIRSRSWRPTCPIRCARSVRKGASGMPLLHVPCGWSEGARHLLARSYLPHPRQKDEELAKFRLIQLRTLRRENASQNHVIQVVGDGLSQRDLERLHVQAENAPQHRGH